MKNSKKYLVAVVAAAFLMTGVNAIAGDTQAKDEHPDKYQVAKWGIWQDGVSPAAGPLGGADHLGFLPPGAYVPDRTGAAPVLTLNCPVNSDGPPEGPIDGPGGPKGPKGGRDVN